MQVNPGDYSRLNVLLAGCGSIGKRHAEVLGALNVRRVTACDPDEAKWPAFLDVAPWACMVRDFDEALRGDRFDAVFILTPTGMHIEMARKALEAGAHVFIEKPLAHSDEGVDELRRLAREKGLQVMVGFCFRFHEALREAKRLIAEGVIGRPIHISAHMGEPFARIQPNYLNMYYATYSGAFELVHDLDLALWFAGQAPRAVHAVYGPYSDMGMTAPDCVDLLIGFEDRMTAAVHLDFFQTPRTRYMEIAGTKGTMIVEFGSWDHASVSYCTSDDGVWTKKAFETRRNDMFRDEDALFLDAVAAGRPLHECTVEDALLSLRVIQEVYRPE